MKVAAGIVGILGGLIALIIGTVGFGLTSAGNSINQAAGGGAIFAGFQYAALIIPIIGLVGAGISFSNAKMGAATMAASAVLLVLIFGFHAVSLIPIALLGVGALLAFMSEGSAIQASPVATAQIPQPAMTPSTSPVEAGANAGPGSVHSTFKGKEIIKTENGVSVDGVQYLNAVQAQIAITNGDHG